MTITAANILLLESERMTDTDDGGGRRTATVIPDGVQGNIFPKVSRADATAGRVNLRKVYGHVDVDTVETYAGAHAIITKPPTNAKISALLFTTRSEFDQRADAQDFVESYVVYGPESRMKLYGRQPVGARAVLIYQRTEETLPEVGEVYCLMHELSDGTILANQYIRVESIAHEVRTFEDEKGPYTYRVVTIGITQPITYAFAGPDTPPRISTEFRTGKVRTTSVADAARYYGAQPLAAAVTAGALSLTVPSIYAPIVPTTLRESALSLAEIGGAVSYEQAGTSFYLSIGGYPADGLYFPAGVYPGSVSAVGNGAAWPASEDGAGTLTFANGAEAAIDYQYGIVQGGSAQGASGGVGWSADHAVQVSQPAHTHETTVTIGNRGTVYSLVLSPIPAPGTLSVDYRALGKWYRLRDETGDGTLSGQEAAWGTGTIDYINGGVVVTLGALPDVDSSVLCSWGSPVHYTQRVGAAVDAHTRMHQRLQLATVPIAAGSLALTFQYSGSPVTLTLSGDTASNANIQANVNPETGAVEIQYVGTLPDAGTTIAAAYSGESEAPSSPQPIIKQWSGDVFGLTALPLGEAVVPGSVRVTLPMIATATGGERTVTYAGAVACYDDGAGNLRVKDNAQLFSNQGYTPVFTGGGGGIAMPSTAVAKVLPDSIVGAINYSTGAVGIATATTCEANIWIPALGVRAGTWQVVTVAAATRTADGSTTHTASASYRPAAATSTAASINQSFTQVAAPLYFDLTTTVGDMVVPGSVVFRIGAAVDGEANRYVDRSGSIVRNVDITTGSGTVCGTINYLTGEVQVTSYPSGSVTGAVSVSSCLTGFGEFSADRVQWRTAGSPVRAGSLYVQAVAEDGTLISGTSDASGNITGALCEGVCNQEFGVAIVRFGNWEVKAGNEGQPWYNADNIDPDDNSRVWKPRLVMPSTLRYSAVVTTNVALDPSLLGLDPVRLPIDGRVPIFRPGGLAVVHHTGAVALPNPAVAGATYSAGRTGLSDIWLVDSGGVRINPALYTYNLSAGTVTMADPLTLTGIGQPLSLRHRISDMVLVSDATIDGRIDIASPLANSYDTSAFISSALMFGDLYARVSHVFDQQTWLDHWLDAVEGLGADAQYNDVLYPLEVLNSGAITERWRVEFTSSTAFRCYGENSGLIATGNTGADFGPVNPLTLEPYFVIRSGGWGSGWGVGQQLRFNTHAAGAPMWMARTILPGAALTADSIDVQLRGDVDA